MRRLMNVIYVMGRLLKAFHIDFNYYRLATWANISEQWPYRLSWIILYSELYEEAVMEEGTSLKQVRYLNKKTKTLGELFFGEMIMEKNLLDLRPRPLGHPHPEGG